MYMRLLNTMSPFLGKKKFQRFFEKLHLFSLYGMNYGRSGDIETSGEEQVFGLIKKQFAGIANGVFLDCGANIGEYALGLAANIPEGSKIYAFEPGKAPFTKLADSTRHLSKITAVNKGVGEKNETVALFSNTVTTKHSSLFKRDMRHWGEEFSLKDPETIDLIRLDNFLTENQIQHVHFIKIDVEGYEMNCLRGLGDYLTSGKVDMIQFEFGVATIDAKVFFKDFYYLLNAEYAIYRILKDGYYLIKNYNEVLEVFITTNYLAVSRKLELKSPM